MVSFYCLQTTYSFLIILLFASFCSTKLSNLESQMQEEICSGITIDWQQQSFSNTSTSKRIYDLLGSFNGKEKLENMLQNRDTSAFVKDYIVVAIPQMVFFGFTLIAIVLFLVCLCKPCCKRHESKGAYSRAQLIYPTIILILFSIGVIVSGIFGVIYNQDFFTSFCKKCIIITLFQSQKNLNVHLLEPSITFIMVLTWRINAGLVLLKVAFQIFINFHQVDNTILSIMNSLDSSQSTLHTTFSQTSWLNNANADLQSELTGIYTDFGNLKVPSADPQATASVQPSIFSNLGPVNNSNSTLGKISYQQNAMTSAMVDALSDLKESVNDITTQYTSIKGNLQQGEQLISDFDSNFEKLNSDVNKVTKYTHKYQKEIHKGLLAYYIVAISIGGLVIVTSCIIAFFNVIKYKLYYFLHISWCSFSLLMFIGFILSMGLMPLSMIMFSGCQVIDYTMENSNNYQTSKLFPSSVSSDVIDNTLICFFGDGDLNQAFETESSLATLNSVTEAINQVQQSSISSLPSSQEYLQSFINQLQNASEHVNAQVDTIPDKYMIFFNEFTNTLTNKSYITECTKPSEDIWVYYSTDCPANTTVWNNSNTATYQFGEKICIVVSEFDPQVYQTQRAQLYTQAEYCENLYENIHYGDYDNLIDIVDALQTSIHDFTVQTQQALQNAKGSIVEYQAHLGTYVSNLTDLQTTSLQTLESSVSTMLNQVSNSKTGLLTGLNCHFLNSSVTAFRSELCTEFVPQSFAFAVIIFVVSFCAFCAAIGAYLLAYRVTYNLKIIGEMKGGFLLPKENNNYFKIEDDFKTQNILDISAVKFT